VPIIELYSEAGVWEQFLHGAFEFDQVFFSQTDLLDRDEGAEAPPTRDFAFFSGWAQVHCRDATTLALLELVAEPLAFTQIVHPCALDGRDVNKDVAPGSFGLDEPVTLLRVEPLDRTGRHQQDSK
jgi:hypothetical protein